MKNLLVEKVESSHFLNFDFTVAVTLPENCTDIPTTQTALKVDVCYESEVIVSDEHDVLDKYLNEDLFEVVSNTNIENNRSGEVTIRLKELSSNLQNRKFVIRFVVWGSGSIPYVGYSNAITTVRYKLKIDEEFSGCKNYVWMKDVGGKDKGIDLDVSLVDKENNLVSNALQRIPLRVELHYQSGVTVQQQDILQLSPDSMLSIGNTGTTRIKCRINEVSSRHQGQLFQVFIAPDVYNYTSLQLQPGEEEQLQQPTAAGIPLLDIGPAKSVPIEVKSKVNTAAVKKRTETVTTTTTTTTLSSGGSSSKLGSGVASRSGSNDSLNVKSISIGNNSGSSSVGVGASVGKAADVSYPTVPPLQSLSSLLKYGSTDLPAALLPIVPNVSNCGVGTESANRTASAKQDGAVQDSAGVEKEASNVPSTTGAVVSVEAAEALVQIAQWAELVNKSMGGIQWTPIGRLGEKNSLTNQPANDVVYNIQNPNAWIQRILSE